MSTCQHFSQLSHHSTSSIPKKKLLMRMDFGVGATRVYFIQVGIPVAVNVVGVHLCGLSRLTHNVAVRLHPRPKSSAGSWDNVIDCGYKEFYPNKLEVPSR